MPRSREVAVEYTGDASSLRRASQDATAAVEGVGEAAGKSAGILGGAGKTALAGGALAAGTALVGLVTDAVDANVELGRQATVTGISTETLSAYAAAAQAAGLDTEGFAEASITLQERILETKAGTADYREDLALLGVSFDDLVNASPAEAMDIVTTALASATDAASATAAAQVVLGGDGQALAAVFRDLGTGSADLTERMTEQGRVVGTEQVEAAKSAQEAMANFQGLLGQLASDLLPALTPLLELVNVLLEALRPILDPILVLLEALLEPLGELLTTLLVPLAELLTAVLTPAIEALTWAMDNGLQPVLNAVGSVVEWLVGRFDSIGDAVGFVVGAVQGFIDILAGAIEAIGNFSIPDLTPGFDIPGIPFLASGGIVSRPTAAVLGEAGPEAVVPLNSGLGDSSRIEELLEELVAQGRRRNVVQAPGGGLAPTAR